MRAQRVRPAVFDNPRVPGGAADDPVLPCVASSSARLMAMRSGSVIPPVLSDRERILGLEHTDDPWPTPTDHLLTIGPSGVTKMYVTLCNA